VLTHAHFCFSGGEATRDEIETNEQALRVESKLLAGIDEQLSQLKHERGELQPVVSCSIARKAE
jgi:hypothetical protein